MACDKSMLHGFRHEHYLVQNYLKSFIVSYLLNVILLLKIICMLKIILITLRKF